MRDVKKIVSDIDLNKEFKGTNFGGANQRDLVKWCLMKMVCGFNDGHTIMCICRDLKLLGKTWKMTKKGKSYLWASFHEHYTRADI